MRRRIAIKAKIKQSQPKMHHYVLRARSFSHWKEIQKAINYIVLCRVDGGKGRTGVFLFYFPLCVHFQRRAMYKYVCKAMAAASAMVWNGKTIINKLVRHSISMMCSWRAFPCTKFEHMMITRKGYVWIVATDHNAVAETGVILFPINLVSINYYSVNEREQKKNARLHKIEFIKLKVSKNEFEI